MPQVVIENPILNSPYAEPARHFHFTDEGITSEIDEGRRVSSYFVPIPRAKKRNPKQLAFETEWTRDRLKENDFINKVRDRVALWRRGEEHGYMPDYIVRIGPPSPALAPLPSVAGEGSVLNLILEVSGEARKDKAAKVAAARNLWAPAINNHGGFGRWAFIEITDPWDAKNVIRAMLRGENVDGVGPLLQMAR